MPEFLNIVLSMPTVVFTILMGFMGLYWVTVIMGAVDIDLFDLDADLGADVDLDVELDADVEVDLEAPSGSAGIFVSLLSALGLVGVPLTISVSILVLYNWAMSFLMAYALGAGKAPVGTLVGLGIMAASMVGSLLVTSVTIRPLRPLFQSKRGARAGRALVGMSVKVTSGSVTPAFGRAEGALEGSVVNFSIRCDDEHNQLKKGSEALIIRYDELTHIYYVEPLDAMLGDSAQHASPQEDFAAAFEALEEQDEQDAAPVEASAVAKK